MLENHRWDLGLAGAVADAFDRLGDAQRADATRTAASR
jgi:hypothetical protein